METNLDAIIAETAGAEPLRRRRVRETLRSVYHVGDFIVKEFDIPAAKHFYRRPWGTEAAALRRMGDDYPGALMGVAERFQGDTHNVFLVKRFIEGDVLDAIDAAGAHDVARTLAGIHSKGIIMDDAHADNFLRAKSGEMYCIDFGRAVVFDLAPAPAFAVGKELAKLYREGLGYDKDLFRVFLREYCDETRVSVPRRLAIALGVRSAVFFRNLRKGRGK